MQVGETEISWPWGYEFASDLLGAIHLLATSNLKRVDHDSFTAYWTGSILRIDIKQTELM